MTWIIKEQKNNNYCISMSGEKFSNLITIEVMPIYKNNFCGYPIVKSTYHYTEQEKASRTFKRYCKKYIEV